jgi:hypothetical protein
MFVRIWPAFEGTWRYKKKKKKDGKINTTKKTEIY